MLRAALQMDFAELGRNYLQAVQPLAGGRKYFVDKLPFNFRYCGLIHQALPNAKIVHLTRDPVDTCYAVFKTLFINAYHYSYQLDELAQFYVAYRRTMEHWHDVMPGVICDVSYEDLVADPPTQCRRLLDWCGLPWQDDVLDFHRSTRRLDDGQRGTGAQADLHVVRAEMAPFRAAVAARGASTRGSGPGRRRGQRIAVASDPADESTCGDQALPSTGRLRIHCDRTHLTPRVGGRPACSES